MAGYAKLFSTIIHSTIWQEPLHVKITWITLLALKDRDGMVKCSVPGLASAAGVDIEQAEESLNKFRSPDKYSSTKDNEGRRIQDAEGGWFILNHHKYQEEMSMEDRRAYWALKQREARFRKNQLSKRLKKRESDTMQRAGEDDSNE